METIEQLSCLVTIFNQFYLVDILYSSPGYTNLAEKIAFGVKEKLQNIFDIYIKKQTQNYTSSAPQTTLLILDRSFDVVTPMMKDFHYMPLLYDLKDCERHKIKD